MQLAHISSEPAKTVIQAVDHGHALTFNVGKKAHAGTFARAIAFASKADREAMGQAMHARWLENGTYRPLVTDILGCGLVSKAALPYVQVMSGLTDAGPVTKVQLLNLCRAVKQQVDANVAKGKAIPKGQKGFVYGLVAAVASYAEQPDTIDAE